MDLSATTRFFQNLMSIPFTQQLLNCKEIIEGLAKVLKKHTGKRQLWISDICDATFICLEKKKQFHQNVSFFSSHSCSFFYSPFPALRNILPITTPNVPLFSFALIHIFLFGDFILSIPLLLYPCTLSLPIF